MSPRSGRNGGRLWSVGGVVFLTALSFVSSAAFFTLIACAAGLVFIAVIVLPKEPKGQMTEILPDGGVQMMNVSKLFA